MKRAIPCCLLLFSFLSMVAWPQESANLPTKELLSPAVANAIFLFGRANYFRAVVKKRNCELFDKDTTDAINLRFENARRQLASRFGEKLFPPDKPIDGPIQEGVCDRLTLDAFNNHVAEIEQAVRGGGV